MSFKPLTKLRPKDLLVVEFFGLPGAGKTTVVNRLCDELRALGHDVVTRWDIQAFIATTPRCKKIGFYLRNFFYAAEILWHAVRFANRTQALNRESARFILLALRSRLGFEYYLKCHPLTQLVLFDHAELQTIWCIGALSNSKDYPDFQKLLNLFADRSYVYIDAQLETLIERISARPNGRSRFDSMSREKQFIHLRYGRHLIESLNCTLEQLRCPVVILRADDPVSIKVDKILKEVLKK